MRRLCTSLLAAAFLVGGLPAGTAAIPVSGAPELDLPVLRTGTPVSFLVTYDPLQTTGPDVARAIRDAGGAARAFGHFPVVSASGGAGAVEAAAEVEGVEHVEPDEPIELLLNAGPHAIGADAVRAPEAEGGLGVDGAGVTIGVIDSGADAGHPDLAGAIHRNAKVLAGGVVCTDYDVVEDECRDDSYGPDAVTVEMENTDTTSGHGSHVVGIAAGDGTASDGRFTGVAPGARVNSVGVGDMASVTWALEGFEYLLEHAEEDNLVVINNSWGAARLDAGIDSERPTHATARAVEAAIARGIAVVFAAGNDGCPTDHSTINPYALIPGVISVANSLRDGEDINDSSSCGRVADDAHDPTVAAPGSDIVSARGGPALYADPLQEHLGRDYIAATGTSMAAPHVAGVVALMQSARLDAGEDLLSPDEITEILADTARAIPNIPSRRQGSGLVDAAAAVATAAAVEQPAPIELPACPIVTDDVGDATAAIWNTPLESTDTLDIVEAELSTDVDAGRLEATVRVVDLDLDALETGTGMYFDVFFRYAGVLHYLFANHDKLSGETSFGIGTLDPVREPLAEGDGAFDASTDEIRWSVPLEGEGYELVEDTNLSSIQVVSRRQLGNVIPNADDAWAPRPWRIGTVC